MITTGKHGELLTLFHTAVAAVHPDVCLSGRLPPPPGKGRLIALAAGKAASAMARAASRRYSQLIDDKRFIGLCVCRRGQGAASPGFELIEAGHPTPDEGSAAAASRALELASGAGVHDLVLVLLSGGASALWTAPAAGVSLADKQDLTRRLLKSGAPIGAVNAVRKHLSRIKGGRLALAAAPARLVTLAMSDVVGDSPEVIGSGPTAPDPTTLEDARSVLARYGVAPRSSILAALADPRNETPKPGGEAFAAPYIIVANADMALAAAGAKASGLGYSPVMLGPAVEGEARDAARAHAALALQIQREGKRAAILSGGELTVTVRGRGRGGPNQEYALALAIALDGAPGVWALAADTDGTDGGAGGPFDPAGAIVTPDSFERFAKLETLAERNMSEMETPSVAHKRDPATFLDQHDSTSFFEALGDLIVTGATGANVNDFRTIIVEPPSSQSRFAVGSKGFVER
jgi:glycerate 2-kinase